VQPEAPRANAHHGARKKALRDGQAGAKDADSHEDEWPEGQHRNGQGGAQAGIERTIENMAQTYEVGFVGIDGKDESVLVISIRHPDPTATAGSINLRVSREALLEFAKHLPAAEELKAHSDHDAADAEALKAARERR
jgi:hypothetical protein